VLNDLTTTINVQLTQTTIALSEEVVIIAEAPLIKKDLTSTESRVTSDEIKNLPIQNVDQLITQQAGVSKDAGGGIHIRGGRSTEISYLINGVSITDDYSRTQALTVETESIQELQIISGTFNAEYGNAMSGVVNVVTKTGGSKFRSNVEVWMGDYVSNHSDIFWAIDKLSPTANYNLQASLSGPIITDKLTFFLSGRRMSNGGYMYGINEYTPVGRNVPGDSSYVSMNSDDRWSGQATLEWQLLGDLKLKIDAFGSKETNRTYNHLYRLDPNGDKGGVSMGTSAIAKITHQIFSTTFQELTLAYKFNDYTSRLYDDPYDPRYVHPDSLNVPGYHFYTSGTNVNRFQRNTESRILKWDVTSQVNKFHLLKAGAEVQDDKVFYENINLTPMKNQNGQDVVPFVPMIQGVESPYHDKFDRSPFKAAVYVQDKIELESMIINFGLRFELFDPRGKIPADREDPDIYNPYKLEHTYKDVNGDGAIGLNEQVDANKYTLQEREAFWYKSATVKTQLSPRFGIAYPITDKGIIRFSYGIFQQIPEYSQLYLGDQFKLTSAQGIQGPFGNNDLKPQRTTIYEIGLQQQFGDNYAIDVTGFYRDIRDWISSSQPIPTFLAGISYSERINRDFANARGVTISLNKRYSNNFSFGVDYTYQIAEGTNSSPDEEFFSQLNGSEPKRLLAPLSWDQTHTLNINIFVGNEVWGASVIGNLSSGQPYTPTLIQGANTGKDVMSGLATNSLVKPIMINFDLEVFRNIMISDVTLQVFVKVFNALDTKNPINVYGDSGKPDFTIEQLTVQGYDKGWFVNPSYYSEPRSIYVGTKISL
jgi:outer membrane receptor for ferrienterochelin and colicin